MFLFKSRYTSDKLIHSIINLEQNIVLKSIDKYTKDVIIDKRVLFYAMACKKDLIVDYLLSFINDPNEILEISIISSRLYYLLESVKNGADVNKAFDLSPPYLVKESSILKYLLDNGLKEDDGSIMFNSINNYESMKLLIDNGWTKGKQDAYSMCFIKKNIRMSKLLLESGF